MDKWKPVDETAWAAWQVLGALWGIHANREQSRIANWFWERAQGEHPSSDDLFPLNLEELGDRPNSTLQNPDSTPRSGGEAMTSERLGVCDYNDTGHSGWHEEQETCVNWYSPGPVEEPAAPSPAPSAADLPPESVKLISDRLPTADEIRRGLELEPEAIESLLRNAQRKLRSQEAELVRLRLVVKTISKMAELAAMDARGYDSGPDAGNFDRISEYALSTLGDENSEQLPHGEPTCCEGGNFGEKHDCRKSNPTMELERENASLRSALTELQAWADKEQMKIIKIMARMGFGKTRKTVARLLGAYTLAKLAAEAALRGEK